MASGTGTQRISENFAINAALGNVGGVTAFRKYGINASVGAGTYDVWPSASTRTLPAAAGVASVVSASAADTNGGTGAWTVYITGVDANYAAITETVTLAGLTPVNTVQQFLRINTTNVVTAGTGLVNAGQITTSIGGNAQSYIEAAQGRCHCSGYCVPAGKTLLIMNVNMGTGRLASSVDLHILGFVKASTANAAWNALQDIYLYQTLYNGVGQGGQLIPEKTDIKYSVTSTGAGQVFVEYSGWLITT